MPYPRAVSSKENLSSSTGSSSSSKPLSLRKFDPNPHAGLVNLGNTCFLNSVIQASASTRALRELFLPETTDHHLEGVGLLKEDSNSSSNPHFDSASFQRSKSPALRLADQEHGHEIKETKAIVSNDPSVPHGSSYHPSTSDLPLNTSFRHTLEKIWNASYSNINVAQPSIQRRPLRIDKAASINPKSLLKQLSKKHGHYGDYGQQDAHEAMRQLWDGMRMEECDMIKKIQPPIVKASIPRRHSIDTTPSPNALLTITSTPKRPDSTAPGSSRTNGSISGPEPPRIEDRLTPWVDMLFCGKLESVVICESCRHISHVYEDFFDVSLSIRPEEARIRKRDRLLGFADRWRRSASKDTRASGAPSPSSTPARSLTPANSSAVLSEVEYSDPGTASEGNILRRGSSPGPIQSDVERGRFQLRRTSMGKKKARASKKGKAWTESEAEPDFPDMASMTLAPVPTPSAEIPLKSSLAEPADIKPNGHTRFADGVNFKSELRQANGKKTSNPRQAAYIARLFADQPSASSSSPSGLQRGHSRRNSQPSAGLLSFPDIVAAATDAAHGGSGAFGGELRDQERSNRERERSRSRARRPHEEPVVFGGPTPSSILNQQSSTGLVSALKQFTSVELLDGDNAFACKRCWRLANPRGEAERETARRKARSRRLRKAQKAGIPLEEVDDAEEADESEESSEDEDDEVFEEHPKTAAAAAAPDASPLSSQPSDKSTSSLPSLISPNGSIAAPSTSSISTSNSTDSDVRDDMISSTPSLDPSAQEPRPQPLNGATVKKLEISADETITPKTGEAVFSATQSMLEKDGARSPPIPSNSIPIVNNPEARRPSLKEVLQPPAEVEDSPSQIIEERKTSIPVIQMEEPRSPPASDYLDASSSSYLSAGNDLSTTPQAHTPLATPMASNNTLAAPVARKGALQLGTASGSDTENSVDEGEANTGTSVCDTGDETDQSGIGDQAQAPSIPKPARAGPKRSSQSLPRRALKRYLISSAPPVLIFHFKRFQATGKSFVSLGGSGNFKKIDDSVSFPEFLDIAPWMAPPREDYDRNGVLKDTSDPIAIERYKKEKAREEALKNENEKSAFSDKEALGRKPSIWHWRGKSPDPSSAAKKREEEQQREGEEQPQTRYRLYAVVVHQGSMSSGHYTSYVLSDRVRYSSDDSLASAPVSRVNTPAPPSRGATPAPPSRTSTPAPVPASLNHSRPSTPAQPHRLSNPPAVKEVITSPSKEMPISPRSSLRNSISSASSSRARTSSNEEASQVISESIAAITSSTSDPQQEIPIEMSKAPSNNGSIASSSAMSAGGRNSTTDGENSVRSGIEENVVEKSQSTSRPVLAASLPFHSQLHRSAQSQTNQVELEDRRRWVFCSDTTVRGATLEEVLSAKAYLLYYERL